MASSAITDYANWPHTTNGGIKYRRVKASGGFVPEEATLSEELILRAQDLLAFANETWPEPFVFGDTLVYPRARNHPGLTQLVTKSLTWMAHDDSRPVDPFSADPSASDKTYGDYVRVTVAYGGDEQAESSSESDANDPFTFMEINASASGEFLYTTSPKAKLAAGSSPGDQQAAEENKVPALPVTIQVPTVDWSVAWPRIPAGFFNGKVVGRMRAALGKVNSNSMPIFYGAPPETIMFVGWSLSRELTWRSNTIPSIKLDMKFYEKQINSGAGNAVIGHNHVYVPAEGWKYYLINDNGDTLYNSTNLNSIFAAAPGEGDPDPPPPAEDLEELDL